MRMHLVGLRHEGASWARRFGHVAAALVLQHVSAIDQYALRRRASGKWALWQVARIRAGTLAIGASERELGTWRFGIERSTLERFGMWARQRRARLGVDTL